MKKLVLLGAALMGAACFADGLASANIVGWKDKGLKNNCQAFAPYFFNVGKDGIKLTDLTVAGYEGNVCDAGVSIQLLDSLGNATATYMWYEGFETRPGPAWYRGKKEVCAANENVPEFKKGDGLWVRATEGLVLKMAGEVFMDDVTFDLHTDCQMIGNPYATELPIQNITVEGYTGNICDGGVSIQVLDELGNATATYIWYEGFETRPGPGWYRGKKAVNAANGNLVNFAAGQALWVRSTGNNYKLVVKSPLAK